MGRADAVDEAAGVFETDSGMPSRIERLPSTCEGPYCKDILAIAEKCSNICLSTYFLQYRKQAGSNYLGSTRFDHGDVWVPCVAFARSGVVALVPALLHIVLLESLVATQLASCYIYG